MQAGKIKSFAFLFERLAVISLCMLNFASSEPFGYNHIESLFSIFALTVEILKKI